jgi:opacity protein-like surface antigen
MLASNGVRCREDAFDVRFPLLSAVTLATLLGAGASAQAQTFLPLSGFAPLPSFAWDSPSLSPKWEGSYARISSGFQVTSGKHIRTSAGPTIGLEAGTMRREGNFVYGIAGAIDYAPAVGGYGYPSFGNAAFTRDIAGAFRVQAGVLVTPDVLLYTSAGLSAANETWRYGATNFSSPFSRSDIAVRPEARAGVLWAVTDKLTIGLEASVIGQQIR